MQLHTSKCISKANFRTGLSVGRWYSTLTQGPVLPQSQGSNGTADDPFSLVKLDFTNFFTDIQEVLDIIKELFRSKLSNIRLFKSSVIVK